MTATDLTTIVQRLREHATLGGAPAAELEWLAAHGYLRRYARGDYVIRTGQERGSFGLFVVLTGHLVLLVDRGRGGRRKLAEWRGGEVSGILPYSRTSTAMGDGVAEADTEIWMVDRDHFPEMIRTCPELTTILVHVMLDRARHFTSAELRDEKLVSLGKLAAGLAHELNNPASAIVRGVQTLGELLDQEGAASRALYALGLSDSQLAAVEAVRQACEAAPVHTWTPLERADREDHLAAWIEAHGGDAEVAAPLAETALSLDALEGLAGAVPDAALEVSLRWIARTCAVRGLRQ